VTHASGSGVRADQPAAARRVAGVGWPLGAAAVLVVMALAAPWLAPVPPDAIPADGLIAASPPSLSHPFGTDPLGRDVLSRVLHGARVSLGVGVTSVLLALGVGGGVGAVAGWAGGRVDALLMRTVDVLLAIPRLLALLAVTALWGALPLAGLALLLGLTGWYDVARLVRAEVRGLRGRDFVLAAQAGGATSARILWRHVTPHLQPTLLVVATLGLANTVALEAGLSFLGLGVQPPQASWGTILGDGHVPGGGRWWLTLFPGLAVVTTVLTCNALADALRRRFAPTQVGT
jgi:peptide/nickel transport system permease protein